MATTVAPYTDAAVILAGSRSDGTNTTARSPACAACAGTALARVPGAPHSRHESPIRNLDNARSSFSSRVPRKHIEARRCGEPRIQILPHLSTHLRGRNWHPAFGVAAASLGLSLHRSG